MFRSSTRALRALAAAALALPLLLSTADAPAQEPGSTSLGGWAARIYHVEPILYPFVQVYVRTFDENKLPLVNLNIANIGLQVRGRNYDPMKRQYTIQTIRQRQEPTRTVLVLDASKSMLGEPFQAAQRAAARFIDTKRDIDQVAILAIRDTKEGYELVSNFEVDAERLANRLADIEADGMKTRLYDTIGAAMQLGGMTPRGAPAGGGADYAVPQSIVVFSDGKDEGSAVSREELNDRITNLAVPVPIYSFAYTKVDPSHFRNLEALSKNSFGKYYEIGEAFDRMQRSVEEVNHIMQNDYVVTFKAPDPPDGKEYPVKIGIEYPSGSGRARYLSGTYEAVEAPPLGPIQERIQKLQEGFPTVDSPYMTSGGSAPSGS